jgi:hypothetical protein
MYNTHNYYKLPRKNCFSFSTAERDIDIIKGKTPSIKGNLKHYLGTMHKESEYRPPIKRFNKKYLPQPNSQRTIDPSLRTLEDTIPERQVNKSISHTKFQSSGALTQSYFNPLISYKNNINKRRELCHSSNKNAYVDHIKLNENPCENDINNEYNTEYKRQLKPGVYTNYEHTTQIYSLPGGIKRKIITRKKNPLYKESNDLKYNDVFQSKVECLPGSLTRPSYQNKILRYKNILQRGANDECKEERNEFRKSRKPVNINENEYEDSLLKNRSYQSRKGHYLNPGIINQQKSYFCII